jgi:hypothetical protein
MTGFLGVGAAICCMNGSTGCCVIGWLNICCIISCKVRHHINIFAAYRQIKYFGKVGSSRSNTRELVHASFREIMNWG